MSYTFYANPDDENEPWLEKAAFAKGSFRNWHYLFFSFSVLLFIVILINCCFKIRIPRTKQEIEADYKRKKLAHKFRKRLKLIQNQEMDELDLEMALEIIRKDYKNESSERENYQRDRF